MLSNKKRLVIFAAAAIILAIAAIAVALAIGAFNVGPQAPNVKFVAFAPEGKQTIKENQIITVTFRVHNFEKRDIDNAQVYTGQKGDSKYFVVDKPNFMIVPAIGAGDGESGSQTITIRGVNLGSQPAIEDTFTVSLYVGTELSDSREIVIRLEPNA